MVPGTTYCSVGNEAFGQWPVVMSAICSNSEKFASDTHQQYLLSVSMAQTISLSREGLPAAILLDMPYEDALAHCQRALLMTDGDRARVGELARARELFGKMAAKYDLNATDAA